MPSPQEVKTLIEQSGGQVNELSLLPDGSGFATASFPLPTNHWIYGDRTCERFVGKHGDKDVYHEPPPMVFRMGNTPELHHITTTRAEFAKKIKAAGRYAVRASTMKGRDTDFDPDALIQNLVVGMLGYWSENGLTDDEWANPKEA